MNASVGSEITYSRACAAGQCCNWNTAQDAMSSLVIDNPDCAELLYDNGVAAYRLKEFEKARAYFGDVAKNDATNINLKKQSHFNLGNTQVALNELPEAIKEYEEVLKIDPNDERAKHNLEKVRELLAQQQEQEKQEQQQNQDGDSQENSDGDSQEQNQNGDGQDSDGDSQDNQSGSQNKDQSDSGTGGEKPERNGPDDDQGDQENQSDGESSGQEQDEQEGQFSNGHDETPDQGNDEPQGNNTASQHTKQDEESQQEDMHAMQQAENQELDKDLRQEEKQKLRQKFSPKEQWMARLLDRRDKADEKANKQLIKATVDKNMAGKYGQNNW